MYKLNPNLESFWRTRKPYKRLKGGRFSSKTQDAAGMAAFLARNYSVKFLCIRQFQNRIADSVYTVIKEKIEQAGWESEFTIGKSSIEHNATGSSFLFYGMARNINDIKGTEGVDICWIEEAEGLTSEQWEVIDPTIRKEGSETWILYNPKYTTDFVETGLPLLLGDSCVTKHINYDQNPFLSDTARAKADRMKLVDYDRYEHIYLGVPLSDQDSVIIKRSWLDACIDAHLKIDGMMDGDSVVGYDVADDGHDKNATTTAKGSVVISTSEWQGLEDKLQESTAKAWNCAKSAGAKLVYDSIGVGAGVGSKANELNEANNTKIGHRGFNAGGKVVNPDSFYDVDAKIKNKDHFANVKAQAWWLFADRVRNTYEAINKGKTYPIDEMISFSSECENLEALMVELSTPRKSFDGNGRVKVESKIDMKKRDVKSPNIADSCIMCYAPFTRSGFVFAC
jgi:phage terminase large subunit